MQIRVVAGALLAAMAAVSVPIVRPIQALSDESAPTTTQQAALAEPSAERPNVLIIMTDDQNTSPDGYAVMDDTMRLFRDGGTHYKNAVATTPLCCPSRASIFSGRYAHNTGVTTQDPSAFDATKTMQYHLKNNGYKVALAGNKYLNQFSGKPPFFDLAFFRAGYYKADGTYSTSVIKNKAVAWLNTFEQNDAQPWLMFLHTTAPHSPYVPETQYENAPVAPWSDNPATTETDRGDKPPYVRTFRVTKATIQARRLNAIRTLYSVDDLVQSVFASLDGLGETNTLAFFTSDNGYVWLEHGLQEKRHPYEQSARVPLFVRWPGHPEVGAPGTVDSRIVANIDIAPTVYNATGINPTNYTPDGRSLFEPSSRDHILMEYYATPDFPKVPSWKGLWNPSWLYSEYPADGFREYYGPDDPWQLNNRFATTGPPSNAAELRNQLQADQSCAGTTCP